MKSSRTPIFGPVLAAVFATATLVLLAVERGTGVPSVQAVTAELFRLLLILGAGAVLLGAVNLFTVHVGRVQRGDTEWPQSLVVLGVALVVIAAGLVDPAGRRSPLVEWIFDHVLAPGQAMLYALTAFFLAAAAYRFLRLERRGGGWLVAGAVMVMLTQMPSAQALWPAPLAGVTIWLVEAPVMAALRGALLGTALALLISGVRYLFGRM
jgi:hypothetical protein